jgi:DNA-binding IscR family transcriptional regulator
MSANSRLTTATHALCWLELSRRRGHPVLTSGQVATSLASHPVLMRRVLGDLRDADLVSSGRGPGAGWSLAKPAQDITLLDVWQAIGREEAFALHPHEPNLECTVGFGIRPVLSDIYRDVEDAVAVVLSGETVATVLDKIVRAPLAS